MVILMVTTCASLLFQVFYFILDVAFLEFTYVPIFYWILKDVGLMFISFHYYLDFTAKFYLDIKIFMFGKNFVILSLWMKCLWYVLSMNAFVVLLIVLNII